MMRRMALLGLADAAGTDALGGLSEEEQNLLYVACTRAIYVLEFNFTVQEYITHTKQGVAGSAAASGGQEARAFAGVGVVLFKEIKRQFEN